MDLKQLLNRSLDRLVRLDFRLGRNTLPPFKLCGWTGVVLAILLGITLSFNLGLSTLVTAGILLLAMLTFLGVIVVTKIITNEELIIYYHHEIAVITVAAAALSLLGQPVVPYLDVLILSVGLFLACGRLGCLMAGCCHGVPHSWGVRYPAKHVELGPYVGVRLFPIQAIESLFVLGVVLLGIRIILNSSVPGEALVWYTVTYGLGRFLFEFMRGDPDRPYYCGFSQPQWISVLLICSVIVGELAGIIGLHPWHFGVAALVALVVIFNSVRDSFKETARRKLLHARHLHEFAGAIKFASDLAIQSCDICKQPATKEIHLARTYLGVQISASLIKRTTGYLHHYTISHQNGILTDEAVRPLTEAVLKIRHPFDSSRLIKGPNCAFHLLVHSPPDSTALTQILHELRGAIEDPTLSSAFADLNQRRAKGYSDVSGGLQGKLLLANRQDR
jgi:hypothetical protein